MTVSRRIAKRRTFETASDMRCSISKLRFPVSVVSLPPARQFTWSAALLELEVPVLAAG